MIRDHSMLRRAAAWTAAACAAGALVVAQQSPAAAAATCHDVYFVSARGSGEDYTADLSKTPEAAAVEAGMTAVLDSAGSHPDVEVHQLTYPAPRVDVLFSKLDHGSLKARSDRLWKHNLPSYLGQERQGEQELVTYLGQILTSCAGTSKHPAVVLTGYSQGSMVVHNVLQTLVDTNATAAMDLIAGSVLIADPERMPASQVLNFGTAPVTGQSGQLQGSYGACPALDLLPGSQSCLPGGATLEVPARFLTSTVAVCDTGDLVCDAGALAVINTIDGYQTAVTNGIFIHTGCHAYCGASARTAGGYLARKLLARGVGLSPLTLDTQTLPAGTVGTPYTATLNAHGGALPYTWSITGGLLLTGLNLAPGGTITGTPVAAGTSVATATVTDTVGHRISAALSITVNPVPVGLTVNNASGPAGIVSWVNGITCPTPAPGATMWVIPQGTGVTTPDLRRAFAYPVYHGGAFVPTSNDAVIGSTDATVTCAENTDATNPAGALPVKTYTFTQTITGPSRRLLITPANDGLPGYRYTIANDGGCGTTNHGLYSIILQVYDTSGQSNAYSFTGLPVDGAGNWGPINYPFPRGPTVSWDVHISCYLDANTDKSGYEYPITTVPVP
jgi:hypothetical protein